GALLPIRIGEHVARVQIHQRKLAHIWHRSSSLTGESAGQAYSQGSAARELQHISTQHPATLPNRNSKSDLSARCGQDAARLGPVQPVAVMLDQEVGAPFGSRVHQRAGAFMRSAEVPAVGPEPKNTSPRNGPLRIAPPVSCATSRR